MGPGGVLVAAPATSNPAQTASAIYSSGKSTIQANTRIAALTTCDVCESEVSDVFECEACQVRLCAACHTDTAMPAHACEWLQWRQVRRRAAVDALFVRQATLPFPAS
jgi:hypothetical protein